MKKITILSFLFVSVINLYGQEVWTKELLYTPNLASPIPCKGIYELSNGHYRVATRLINVIEDFKLYEINEHGHTVSEKAYQNIKPHSMILNNESDFIFAGEGLDNSMDYWGVALFKTNAEGDSLWTKVYGGDEIDNGYDIKQTADGGYIVVGYSESFSIYISGEPQQHFGLYLIRTDEYGDTLWTKNYSYNNDVGVREFCTSVAINSIDNSYMIAGRVDVGDWEAGIYYANFDDNANLIWENQVDYSFNASPSRLRDVKPTNDGNFIFAGDYSAHNDNIYHDAFLMKTNSMGDVLASNTYAFAPEFEFPGLDEYASEIQTTDDGGYIVVGKYGVFPALWKVNENLEMQWYKQFDFFGPDLSSVISYNLIRSVISTSDGGYLLLCRNKHKVFLIKTDSLGNCEPTANYDFSLTDSLSLSLTSSSIAANTLTWHFGDGDTLLVDTLQTQSIAHNYEEAGIYEVCLVAQNLCANDTLCQNINIGNVSSADFWKKSELSIYPNPTKNEVYITAEFPKKVSQYNIRIYDATSCLLKEENNLSLHSETLQAHFSLENYAKGIYFVEIVADDFSVWEKVVKF